MPEMEEKKVDEQTAEKSIENFKEELVETTKNLQETLKEASKEKAEISKALESCATKSEIEALKEDAIKPLGDRIEKMQELEDTQKSMKERLEVAENAISKGNFKEAEEKSMTLKSFTEKPFVKDYLEAFLQSPRGVVSDPEVLQKNYNVSIAENGGRFFPADLQRTLLEKIVELSTFSQDVNNVMTDMRSITYGTLEKEGQTFWVGENEEYPEQYDKFGGREILMHKLGYLTELTDEVRDFGQTLNVREAFLANIPRKIAKARNQAIWAGNGIKKPFGIIKNTDITGNSYETAVSGKIDYPDLVGIITKIKEGYSPKFYFNRNTWADIMTIQDGAGQYFMLTAGIINSSARSILGYNYSIAPDMPEVAGDSYAIMFADLNAGYTTVSKSGMGAGINVKEDDITGMARGQNRILVTSYMGGMPIMPEAIKLMQVKA